MSGPPGMAGAKIYLQCRDEEELRFAVNAIMNCDLSHHFAVHKDMLRLFASEIAFGIAEPPVCGCLRALGYQPSSTTSS